MPRNSFPPDASSYVEEFASADPDHHLWRNGRLWWIAFTVHLPGWRKDRVRFSLGTDDVEEARRRRDRILREYPAAHGCELSLRLAARRPRRCPAGPELAACA